MESQRLLDFGLVEHSCLFFLCFFIIIFFSFFFFCRFLFFFRRIKLSPICFLAIASQNLILLTRCTKTSNPKGRSVSPALDSEVEQFQFLLTASFCARKGPYALLLVSFWSLQSSPINVSLVKHNSFLISWVERLPPSNLLSFGVINALVHRKLWMPKVHKRSLQRNKKVSMIRAGGGGGGGAEGGGGNENCSPIDQV